MARRPKGNIVNAPTEPTPAPCGLSHQALNALWVVFGPQSKMLQLTPAEIPIVAEIQQWAIAQAKLLPPPKE